MKTLNLYPDWVGGPAADECPAGTFHGGDEIPPGTFHGGDEIPPGTFHGGDMPWEILEEAEKVS